MTHGIAALSLIAAMAGSAQAAFFSFASDPRSGDVWTFHNGGVAGKIFDENPGGDGTKTFTFWYDDDNGPLAPKSIDVEFNADFQIVNRVASTALGGGKFMHIYRLSVSTFTLVDVATGAAVLRADFFDAYLSAVGDINDWDGTATIQVSDQYGFIRYTSGINDPAYGLVPGPIVGPSDLSFTLTAINNLGIKPLGGAPRGVSIDPNTGLPLGRWWSEGSYSGSAIPTPGALAVLGLVGLFAGRRRR